MIGLALKSGSDAPGTLSFLVVFGMAVILFFLFRSLSKHLRKVSGPGRGDGGAAAVEHPTPAADDYPKVDAAAIRAARRAAREQAARDQGGQSG